MPAYVRKQPLAERVTSALNLYDWNLWLREEIESRGWDQLEKGWAVPIGIVLNLVFLIARANAGRKSRSYDDVFGDYSGPGWGAAVAWSLTTSLTILCAINTFYTLFRQRTYRLFEADVSVAPQTPSARRVKLDSPLMSSPLRFITSIWGSETAGSRAYPNKNEDVWEIAVWDPLPVSLGLFCYFSPVHVILYWMSLPTLTADPSPSMTVFRTIALALLISFQLSFMSSRFSQQAKDAALISKEVLHEYDTKYVKPNTRPLYRDVGTQFTEAASHSRARDEKYNLVDLYQPAFVINRGFRINPNPDYMPRQDAAIVAQTPGSRQPASTPDLRHSMPRQDFSSPLRPQTAVKQPHLRPSAGGGSLGVYSHAGSPLRKSASTSFSPTKGSYLQDVARNRASQSPEKRRSASGVMSTDVASQRWAHLKPDRARRETGNF